MLSEVSEINSFFSFNRECINKSISYILLQNLFVLPNIDIITLSLTFRNLKCFLVNDIFLHSPFFNVNIFFWNISIFLTRFLDNLPWNISIYLLRLRNNFLLIISVYLSKFRHLFVWNISIFLKWLWYNFFRSVSVFLLRL